MLCGVLVAMVALLVSLLGAVPPLADLARLDAGPVLGTPCRAVSHHPVRLVEDSNGSISAAFVLADGAIRGRRQLSADEAAMIATRGAYVSDVRLGSYEPVEAGRRNGQVACSLDPTWHFYCPALDAVDQLCITLCTQAPCPASTEDQGPPSLTACRKDKQQIRSTSAAVRHWVIRMMGHVHDQGSSRVAEGRPS